MKQSKTAGRKRKVGTALRAVRPQQFHGATFIWNTPSDGPKTIGVIATPSGDHYVGWWSVDHVGVRLSTHRLPVMKDADVLQIMLEDYAELRGLAPVKGGAK